MTRRGSCALKPIANVDALGPDRFRATTDDPKFLVRPAFGVPTGAVRLELRVPVDSSYPYAPQLFWSPDRKWRATSSVRLPAPVDGLLTATIGIPEGTRRLRLDVGDDRGDFGVVSFTLRKESLLTRARAVKHERRRRTKIATGQGRTSGGPPAVDIYSSADNLQRAREVTAGPRTTRQPATHLVPGVTVVIHGARQDRVDPLIDRLNRERPAFEARGLCLETVITDRSDPATTAKALAGSATSTVLLLGADVGNTDERLPLSELYDALEEDDTVGVVGAFASSWPVPAVTGACLMISHELLSTVGGLDDGYASDCADVALCLSVHRLGRACKVVDVGLAHPQADRAGAAHPVENLPDRQRFLRHWGAYLEAAFR